LATTLAGSAPGSKRLGSLGIGTGGAPEEVLGVTTAAAVLLAAANRARTLSAIADSLSPIFSMICSKNITGLFRSRKTLKNAKTALKILRYAV
jgi:uncharacterized membrane-anchored protein